MSDFDMTSSDSGVICAPSEYEALCKFKSNCAIKGHLKEHLIEMFLCQQHHRGHIMTYLNWNSQIPPFKEHTKAPGGKYNFFKH